MYFLIFREFVGSHKLRFLGLSLTQACNHELFDSRDSPGYNEDLLVSLFVPRDQAKDLNEGEVFLILGRSFCTFVNLTYMYTLKCLSIGTPKAIHFPFVSNEKLMFLGVPVFKHIVMRL